MDQSQSDAASRRDRRLGQQSRSVGIRQPRPVVGHRQFERVVIFTDAERNRAAVGRCRGRIQQEIERDLSDGRGRKILEDVIAACDAPPEPLTTASCFGLEEQAQILEIGH
jgi:hypothetical protein